MSEDLSIASYLRNGDECYDASRLQSFLIALKVKGYYVCGSDWRDVMSVRFRTLYGEPPSARPLSANAAKIDPESLFIPTISQMLNNDVDEFIHDRKEELDINIYAASRDEKRKDFECNFSLYPQDGIISIVVGDYYEFHYYNEFLEVLQLFYDVWHPIYGFQEGTSDEPYISREEALAQNIYYLHELNIFGPEIVAKLGRDKVLKSPAWRMHKFDDGGVLLVPALYISGRPHEEYRFSREEVGDYLGLQHTVPGEEEDEEGKE